MINTGYLIQPTLKKVTNDEFELPLDENNQLCSISGLPQDKMDNPIDSENYKIFNTESCPIPPESEVIAEITDAFYDLPFNEFKVEASISQALSVDIVIRVVLDYIIVGGSSFYIEENIFIGAGQLTGSSSIEFYSDGAEVDVTNYLIIYVTPNPAGGKLIIF